METPPNSKKETSRPQSEKLYSILGRKSRLNLHNKFLLYRVAIIGIWSCGIQVGGCAKKLNIDIIQMLQNKALRTMTSAPWYVNNETIHKNLRVKYIREIIQQVAISHKQKIVNHSQWISHFSRPKWGRNQKTQKN